MGKKDFERANCVRAFLGESANHQEQITKLECNLDDITGEDLGFALQHLLKSGAYEVYTQAVTMKKSRPGTLLTVICNPDNADLLAAEIMKHTTTLGIRREDLHRYALHRTIETADTPLGPVRIKKASGMGVEKSKWEYDDLSALAEKLNLSLTEIRNRLK